MPEVFVKSARIKAARTDGTRVLVERAWPAGLGRDTARIHAWLRELGPSPKLRRWFRSHPAHWTMFRRRYLENLAEPESLSSLERLYELAATRPRLTLLHASTDPEHNAAVVLKQLLEGMRKPPSSSGPARHAASASAASRRRPRR